MGRSCGSGRARDRSRGLCRQRRREEQQARAGQGDDEPHDVVLGRRRRTRRQQVAGGRRQVLRGEEPQHQDQGRRAAGRYLHRDVPGGSRRQVGARRGRAVGDRADPDAGLGRGHDRDLGPHSEVGDQELAEHGREHLRRQDLGDAALPDRDSLDVQQGAHETGRHHRLPGHQVEPDHLVLQDAAREEHRAVRVRQRHVLDDAADDAGPEQAQRRGGRRYRQGELHLEEVRALRGRLEADGRREVLQRRRGVRPARPKGSRPSTRARPR